MTPLLENSVQDLLHNIRGLNTAGALDFLTRAFPGQVTFSSSFSYEDQVITHDILSNDLPVSIFTLDTGRLFPETYSVWVSTNERYHTKVKAYYPDQAHIGDFVASHGPNSFYESVDNRKSCCHIRKVEPLRKALAGNAVWVTGLRAEHSVARHDLSPLEWDPSNNILKFHPLLDWKFDEVKSYINKFNIPYNPLHDRGFVSIGCAPVPVPSGPGRTSELAAGGGKMKAKRNADCMNVHSTSPASFSNKKVTDEP